jgi:hypothetical protein
MFSKLDGIFQGLPPRHVENANTRLEIRRDESENQRKKKDHDADGEYSAIPWEDIAFVSIASLRTFLESIVTTETELDINSAPPPVNEATTALNQRAASAYQSVGRAVHDQNVTAPAVAPTHIETNFSDVELARVRIYISDLADLSRRGVTELGMQRSSTFLESIGEAIQKAKADL